ncbi:GlxA family transcriptional regulator [Yinghuangia soli]|uniref:Helix-turn-helix domain-containing protein n=1 Tax=Yinghuangia soli TaxID=2908204 RepID=A0AA41U278_9ACTN|nr:helix-turn-helix domain-containing protein [Yinghuangia soli]MCF2531508.1 helix-turn-helix domain-containing protein [Yinghuangia soli]
MTVAVVLAPPRALASSVVTARDLLWAAARGSRGGVGHQVLTVSLDGRPVQCQGGTVVTADAALAEVPSCSLVFVAAFTGDVDVAIAAAGPMLRWLRDRDGEGALLTGGGTGACLLAASGVLDGGEATTFPPYVVAFRRLFPKVRLRPTRPIVRSGRVTTAHGLVSSMELLAQTSEQIYGRASADRVANRFVFDVPEEHRTAVPGTRHESAAAARARPAVPSQRSADPVVVAAQFWLEEHIGEPVTVTELARHLDMTPRTVERRFLAALGTGPRQYLRQVRMAQAELLLAESTVNISEVARLVGYQDVSAFYRAFGKVTGRRPGDLRRMPV